MWLAVPPTAPPTAYPNHSHWLATTIIPTLITLSHIIWNNCKTLKDWGNVTGVFFRHQSIFTHFALHSVSNNQSHHSAIKGPLCIGCNNFSNVKRKDYQM
jgi:hypothetical protein